MRTIYYKDPADGMGFAEALDYLESYNIAAHEHIIWQCCGTYAIEGDHHVCPAGATRGHRWLTIGPRLSLPALIYCGICGFHARDHEAQQACRGKTDHVWVDGRCSLCFLSNGGDIRPCRGEPPRISANAHRCNGGQP